VPKAAYLSGSRDEHNRPRRDSNLGPLTPQSHKAQPVPKAAYLSGNRDEHNGPRRDSNLGPLTPQSHALTSRPL